MHIRLLALECLSDTTRHNAFTTLCVWDDRYYCAWRTAQTHQITPRGEITIHRKPAGGAWTYHTTLTHPYGDIRDPKLYAAQEALYCMAGIYLPHPALHDRMNGLATHSADNVLHTHLCYTTDGNTWSEWVPILRPNIWGWSIATSDHAYVVAAYHTGQAYETSSIVLWGGTSLLRLIPIGVIYDGASREKEYRRAGTPPRLRRSYAYPSLTPSEPVLYTPTAGVLACFVRTEGATELGVCHDIFASQSWHWWHMQETVHISTVHQINDGWLVAARTLTTAARTPTTTTCLYSLYGQTLAHLCCLPSAGDTGYADIAHGWTPDTFLISYYSQHAGWKQGAYGTTLPGSAVYIATVKVGDHDTTHGM